MAFEMEARVGVLGPSSPTGISLIRLVSNQATKHSSHVPHAYDLSQQAGMTTHV